MVQPRTGRSDRPRAATRPRGPRDGSHIPALEVHLPGREDLVCFKLYASVDQGERSKHFADLRALTPTPAQLLKAARWTRTHDQSPAFLGELRHILGLLGVEVTDADL